MTRRLPPTRRAGFTIVELMIVVVIIAILSALLLAGVAKVQRMGAVTTANSDISTLSQSCEQFKQAHGFYPPSAFRLPSTVAPPTTTLEGASFALLKQMYPRWNVLNGKSLDSTNAGAPLVAADWNTIGMDVFFGQNLDGNQSMVLFLGGPQQTGWATDRPMAPSAAATTVKGPYFDFKQDRLDGTLGGPRHYLDPFKYNPLVAPNGTPYAYFGSTAGGKYGTYPPYTPWVWSTVTVYPFFETATKPVNSGTIQIISAGEDGVFGSNPTYGAVFVAGQGNHAEATTGADDVANFNNGSKLGVGK